MKRPSAPQFAVRGEQTVYDNIVSANRAARKRGRGSEVIRLSDGEVMSFVPGYIPPAPRER